MTHRDQPLKGILYKVASALAFAIMSAIVKQMSDGYSVGQIVFFRSLFALALLVAWLRMRGEFPRAIHTRARFGHLLRGLAGSGGMFFSFIGLALLPLPDATAISYLTPLLVVALAALLLGERVRIYRWSAVAIGFCGVLVMVSEHLGEGASSRFGAFCALAAAAFAALATVQTRRLALSEPTGAIVFYFSALTTFFGFALMTTGFVWPASAPLGDFLAGQKWNTPGFGDLGLLVAIGLLGGVGQIFLTECVRYADASIVAPFDYTSMVWAVLLGYFAFGERPTTPILAGSAIVIAAGLFVLWREHRLGLIQMRPRTAAAERMV